MSVIYIREQGSIVKRVSERLIVCNKGKDVLEISASDIDSLALFGNVQITNPALQMLLELGVDVNYFSYSGKYLGKATGDRSKNIFLRLSQYAFYNDLEKRLEVGRTIVKNKAENQLKMIKRHDWRNLKEDGGFDRKACTEQLEKLIAKIPSAVTSNSLMGVEGMCSNTYFNAFGKMLSGDFEFNGRNRRPPRDPVNIMLSLGYTFLLKEVSAALEIHAFEMYLGFLHGVRYGRKSLPLDIMEEFRQPVVDRLVIKLTNSRIMNRFDFEDSGDLPVLNDEGFKKFCLAFEHCLDGEDGKDRTNYRHLIMRQADRLKKAVLGGDAYIPYSAYEEPEIEESI